MFEEEELETRNFINGQFIDSSSKLQIPIMNPADQTKVGFIEEASEDEIDLAFQAASTAFSNRVLQDMDSVFK